MRKLLLASCFGAAALFTAGYAVANDELAKMAADPNQWVMPAGDYANTRYSELNQINTENVNKLGPAWTFSTGVLRGHEGAPLVIGDVMYLHARSRTSSMRSTSTTTARSSGSTSPSRIRTSSR